MSDRDALVGTEFEGRYQILRLLGEGGMGAVYEARQKFTGKHVALKLVHPMVARSPTAQERFVREAQAPNAIDHPAIVQAMDAGIAADGTPYLALELLDGEDLGRAIDAGRVTPAELVSIGADVLDALAAAHQAGLVHRDIKPENVFLLRRPDGSRQVKILDFGITRQLGEGSAKLTGTGTILGTPLYMSPEQARGEPVDHRADLWSVGAMLFHGLSGHPPFDGDNYNVIIVAILTTERPSLASYRPDLPAELCAVVERALEKNAADRWQSALEMKHALEQVRANASTLPGEASFGTAPTLASDEVVGGPGGPHSAQASATGSAMAPSMGSPAASAPPSQPAPASVQPAVTPQGMTGAPAAGAMTPYPVATAAPAVGPAPSKKSSLPLVLGILGAVGLLCVVGGVAAMFMSRSAPTTTEVDVSGPEVVVEDSIAESAGDEEAEPGTDEGETPGHGTVAGDPMGDREPGDEPSGEPADRAPSAVGTPMGGEELVGGDLAAQIRRAGEQAAEARRQARRDREEAEATRAMVLNDPQVRCWARCEAQTRRCRRSASTMAQRQQCGIQQLQCIGACGER